MEPMTTTVITTVIAELSKSLVVDLFNGAKSIWGKSDVARQTELENEFEGYLNYAYEKNTKIKTLIYKNVSRELKSFYEPLNIRFEERVYNTTKIEELINSLGNRIIVSGIGGMGKSTLMRYLFLTCIEEKYALPLLVEFREFEKKFKKNSNYHFEEYLYDYTQLYGLNISKEVFDFALKQGNVILLLDGFDELDRNTAGFLETEIKEFSIKYDNCKIVVSSRPSVEFQNWHSFIETDICTLTKSQSISLINKLDLDDQNLKEQFITVLEGNLYDTYTEFASVPLLLTIMLVTYKDNASIPKNLHDFYDKAFNTLFYQHDASKGSYQREIICNLNREGFRDVLTFFSFNSYYNNDYDFTEEELLIYLSNSLKKLGYGEIDPIKYLNDLEKSVCLLIKEGSQFKFIHRSFQEYFAALFLTNQDDEVQTKVIKSLIEKRKGAFIRENTFINTFKFSQPSRYEVNVLYQLSKTYKNKSLRELYEDIFNMVNIRDRNGKLSVTRSVYNIEIYFVYREFRLQEGFIHNDISQEEMAKKLKQRVYTRGNRIIISKLSDEQFVDLLSILEPSLKIKNLHDWIKNYNQNKSADLGSFLGLI